MVAKGLSTMTSIEPCGDCGFDHDLDPEYAANWHNAHPGSYSLQVIRGDCFRVASAWSAGCVDLVVTDPPYGGVLEADWDKAWSIESYNRLSELIRHILKPGGTAYVWGGIGQVKNRIFLIWLSQIEWEHGLRLHSLITWSKKRAYGLDNNYLFTREECAMLVKPLPGERLEDCSPSTFNIPLLDEKRGYAGYNAKYPAKSEFLRRTNVWTDVTELLRGKIHPAEKPSRLAEIMIETSSNPNDLVVDLFAGSGSTAVAARKLGRRCVLIEKSQCPMHEGIVTG
jgi:site-specific DNA-methyltransferase (adenine-specific)